MPAVTSSAQSISTPTSPSNSPQKKFNTITGFQWRRFMRVGSEDTENIRVERRVRKVRSDLAQRISPSVNSTKINVAATPSQSDIGEDNAKTDDDRSMSGQSTRNSYQRSDRADIPSRSTSVDPDRMQRDDRESIRKSPNFAGIPEEMERERQPSEGVDLADEKDLTPVAKRERKHRRHVQRESDKVTVNDFDMIRVLGKGCAGKVLLVRHLPSKGLFAMKSIHKRHVLAHQELQHTLTEQAVLKRMAKEVMDPFVVKLWWSFHDKNTLYLIMDFHPGGDLATQLSRWGRLGRDRARFYAAEIVEGVEGLHRAGVIYRDLKPENVLIGADGHIVLSDFGLSKEFPVRDGGRGSSTSPPGSPTRSTSSKDVVGHSQHQNSASDDNRSGGSSSRDSTGFDNLSSKGGRNRWADERDVTTTFCGTAEYLAPEVIQGAAYSYEVDWWSFGTMLYEMLTGITPFWADTHADMYVRVLHDELVFPDDRVLDQDTKSILRGLLQRNPMLRMKEPRIKRHPYFSMIEWAHVFHKRYIPPYIPPINPLDETDTQNFDEAFLDMQPVVNGAEDGIPEDDADTTAVSNNNNNNGSSKTSILDSKGTGVAANGAGKILAKDTIDNKSLFDGYSFRGRKDSESVKSSIFSYTGGVADDQYIDDAALVSTSAAPPAQTVSTSTKPSTAAVAIADEDSEDDDAAALAAVAALDHLEREAANDELMSSPSNISSSTRPTSTNTVGTPKEGSDDFNLRGGVFTNTPSKVRVVGASAAAGLAIQGTIAENDNEGDEDWDMVDVPNAAEMIHSEVNGGKGQNLFSRGVVDTYRLIRRQESSRVPASPSNGPFNRLSRKNRNSRRNLQPTDQNRNGSAVSLGSRSGNEGVGGGSRVSEEGSQEIVEKKTRLSAASPLPSSVSTPIPTPVEEVAVRRGNKKAGSPNLDSSEDIATQERNKQRLKKMKRFTHFFDTSR